MAKTGESQTGSVSFFFVVRRIVFEIFDNSKEKSTFKLYYIPGDFLLLFPPFLFTVHIRLVLSPCQAGNTCCFLSCFFKTCTI